MKKKLLTILLAIAMLIVSFGMQTMLVSAEETESANDDLRAWFNFSEETTLGTGRGNIFFDVKRPETVLGAYGEDVSITEQSLNGCALKFTGSTGLYEEELGMLWNASSFQLQSMEDMFIGDNITINIVFQNETNNQMQPIFCAGSSESNYLVLMTSWSSENAGPRMALKANDGTEQIIVAAVEDAPETNTWNMLTYVQEGNKGRIYLNGKAIAEADLQYKLEDISSKYVYDENMYFYSLGAPTVFENDPGFKGLIDDFRIYGSALTETEIQELATSLNIEVDTDDDSNDEENNDNNNENEGNDSTTPADGVVIDWDFSNEDSIADVTLGNGVTVENGKAVFAPGNEGIALPDDIFKDAETVTVEMTLQPSAFANYRALLCGGNQNGKWFVMGVMEDGSVRYALATNGQDSSETKGNSTSTSEGNAHASYQSGAVLTTDAEHTVKYVITQAETNVYIDGELALTLPTADKDAIGSIGGPVVLGKATKWPDSSYEGTISSFKVTLGTVSEEEPEEPTIITTASGNFVDADSNAEGLNMTDNNSANVGASYDGAWLGFEDVDFGEAETKTVEIVYVNNPARCKPDAALEIWIGGKNADEGGVKVGAVALVPTSENNDWFAQGTATATLDTAITGVQDVYFVMTGSEGENPYIANLFTYKFYAEVANDEGSDDGSDEGSDNDSNNNSGSGDNSTNKPSTGDVAMLATLLTAGVAALGGLKLKKKMK